MNKVYCGKISEQMRDLIQDKLNAKMPVLKISKMLNVSPPTIYRIKNKVNPKPSGRKPTFDNNKLNGQIKRAIKTMERKAVKITASKILSYLSEPVHLRTLQRELKKSKMFTLRNIRKKIILTDEQKRNRLRLIKAWFEERIDFNKVIFTDECRFSLDGPDNFLSWQLDDDVTKYRQSRAFSGGSVMIFGLMGSDGFLEVRKIDGTLDGRKYSELLDRDIIPLLKARYISDFVYQQDNARPHTSRISIEVLNKYDIKLLPWPPHSPDLSLIENVWKLMKDKVYDGVQFSNKEDLWKKIQEVVTEINNQRPSVIIDLYSSIIQRYLKVIENIGDNK